MVGVFNSRYSSRPQFDLSMDELQQSWDRLTLTESENEVVEDVEEIDETKIPGKYFLLGRLLSIRPFNSQALINTLTKIWKPAKELTVDVIDNNCFLF